MENSELRIEVLDAFEALTLEISHLCATIAADAELIAWVHDESSNGLFHGKQPTSAREQTIQVLSQVQYLDEQAPREIILLPGFIGSSKETLSQANKVNACKDRFKNSMLAIKRSKISLTDENFALKLEESLPESFSRHSTLKKMGLGRLHLKQCYRKIPILKDAPQKISWTWAHTRSIKKITVSMAKELLHKKGSDIGINIQLQKLGQLSEFESLAIVQELAPHLRANVVLSGQSKKRMMIKGPIPLFFPCETKTPFPKFTPPKQKQARNENRLIRSDVRLEPIPYLSAIRAHRYTLLK